MAVAEKTGHLPNDRAHGQAELRKRQLAEAPDYIQKSPLDERAKFALWQAKGLEPAKQILAARDQLPWPQGCQSVDDAVRWHLRKVEKEESIREANECFSEADLAREIAEPFFIYDKEKDAAALGALIYKLSAFTKKELLFLHEIVFYLHELKCWGEIIKTLKSIR